MFLPLFVIVTRWPTYQLAIFSIWLSSRDAKVFEVSVV